MGLERAARTTRLPCLTPCSKTCGGCRRARRMLGVLGVCGLLPSPVHLVPSSGTASRLQRLPRAAIEEPHARLILVRHGQSEWNRANRFTGWADVDLTEVGISDAREAGKLLAAEGLSQAAGRTPLLRDLPTLSCPMCSVLLGSREALASSCSSVVRDSTIWSATWSTRATQATLLPLRWSTQTQCSSAGSGSHRHMKPDAPSLSTAVTDSGNAGEFLLLPAGFLANS